MLGLFLSTFQLMSAEVSLNSAEKLLKQRLSMWNSKRLFYYKWNLYTIVISHWNRGISNKIKIGLKALFHPIVQRLASLLNYTPCYTIHNSFLQVSLDHIIFETRPDKPFIQVKARVFQTSSHASGQKRDCLTPLKICQSTMAKTELLYLKNMGA